MSIPKTKYQLKYEKYREHNLQNKREHYQLNKDRIKAYQDAYRAAHKKEIAARDKAYKLKNREQEYLRVRARAAKVKGKVIKEEITNWGTGICGICDEPHNGKYEFDHIMPLSKGGEHTASNLQLAHRYCNRSKKDRIGFKINKTALADGLFVS